MIDVAVDCKYITMFRFVSGGSHLHHDHPPTDRNRNDCSVNVETVKENATPETDHELEWTETSGMQESLRCSGHAWEEQVCSKSPIGCRKDIRADENKMRPTADSELDVCQSKVFGALMRKEQFQEKNLIPNECNHDELGDIMCVQITSNRTESGSKFFMEQFPDTSVLSNPGSNEETTCMDQMSVNLHTVKSSRCLSSQEYSDPQADKRVNNKMSVFDAVEQFSVKLKMIRNEVIYGCKQLGKKPADSETQPLTFHVQESSCDQPTDCTTSSDQQVDGRQSHDWGRCNDNESCDLTFHITDEDLMVNGDNLEDCEDSQLSDLTFH